MFIGRKQELENLEKLYAGDRFELAVIYGRRRVGKTTLINEFVKGKETIYFTALESNMIENLQLFSQSIYSLSKDFRKAGSSFLNFSTALDTVFEIAKTRRIVLVIDEYPYLAGAYKAISSLLQSYIDHNKEISRLFIILCGSSLSFMENQVLGYKSPLFGRRTAQFKIKPFLFIEFIEYYSGSDFDIYDLATIYAITGGIPLYMSLINPKKSLDENIKMNFLTPSSYLYEEPGNLIKQECREPAQYNSIIKAIATGSSRLSEIATKAGIESALCSVYILKLISIGIIRKETPYGEKSSRKTIYTLEDSMFRFWYRFIPDNSARINQEMIDDVYEIIKPQISTYMSNIFEEICKQYLWQLNRQKKSAIFFSDLGRWWGNDKINRRESEIDILATDEENNALFAECKWTNSKVNSEVLETLIERSRLFSYKNKYYYLFAKTGFTDLCVKKADKAGNIFLISFDEMFKK